MPVAIEEDKTMKGNIPNLGIKDKSALYNGFEVNDYTTKMLECLGSSATFIKNNYIFCII